MNSRIPHILQKNCSVEDIKKSLAENGVVFIPGYLKVDQIEKLRNEITMLVRIEHPKRLSDGDNNLARYKLEELEQYKCPVVKEVAKDKFLSEVANDFFYPYLPDLHKIYCHHDKRKMSYNTAWHHDRGLTLKYFFYLNDVTEANGAFCYDLGSQKSNAVKQHLWWQANMPILNYIPDNEVNNPEPMEGPAGSLILFDVSGYHKASEIINSGERMVVRFHIRSGKRIDGKEPDDNPYARRNWKYRSACWTEREEEKINPWGPMKEKKGKNNSSMYKTRSVVKPAFITKVKKALKYRLTKLMS